MRLANSWFLTSPISPAWKTIIAVESELGKKYPGRKENIDLLIRLFPTVYKLLNGEFKGKRVLDLGCGSVNSPDDFDETTHEPWLSRALYELGAYPIGIDVGGLSNEKFEGHTLDLSRADITKIIEPHSIDLACAFGLFDSPSHWSGEKLFHKLLPQLDKIVKPEGIFSFSQFGTRFYDKMEYGRFLARTHYADVSSLEGAGGAQ